MRKTEFEKLNNQVFCDGKVEVFDDLLSASRMSSLYQKAVKESYKIGWPDTQIIEHSEKVFLHATLKHSWLKDFLDGVKEDIRKRDPEHPLLDKISSRSQSYNGIINCGILSDSYLAHTHPGTNVMLYYANLEWRDYWNGETSFFSDDLSEIVFTSKYKPGRILWFDGELPHTIKPVSHTGPKFRFTFSIFFEKQAGRIK